MASELLSDLLCCDIILLFRDDDEDCGYVATLSRPAKPRAATRAWARVMPGFLGNVDECLILDRRARCEAPVAVIAHPDGDRTPRG